MDFGQGVEATGREPECVCALCELLAESTHVPLPRNMQVRGGWEGTDPVRKSLAAKTAG